jgi:hypothetical protein
MPSDGDYYTFSPANDGWLRLYGGASGQGNMIGDHASLAVGNLYVAGSISGPGASGGGGGGGTSNWVRAYHTVGGSFNGDWIPPFIDSNSTPGIYNSGTGVYTCPTTGWYRIDFYASIDMVNQSSTTPSYVIMYKNNVQFQRYFSRPLSGLYSGTQPPYSSLSPYIVITGYELVYCSANTQLRMVLGAFNLFASGTNGAPGFSIYKIS